MKYLLSLVLIGTLSCASSSHTIQDNSVRTPVKQVKVYFPSWLDNYQPLKEQALKEIDKTALPEDWVVYIELPIYHIEGHTLVRGHTDYQSKAIHVGWRATPYEMDPVLPALTHEVDHVLYGPLYGHFLSEKVNEENSNR